MTRPPCTVELAETREGWHLTIRLADAEALDSLTRMAEPGLHPQAEGELTLSISPNLVPAHPFGLVDVQVIVADPASEEEGKPE